MTTPYTTPRYPRAPYSTPISQSASRKVPRAPIHNPFDQFPEPEFQAWIGDITGALKAALGRGDPIESKAMPPERVEREEEVLEDSFADVKARRAAKGKERAVEVGDQEQPIVIESDEEEEEEESEEVARAIMNEEGGDWAEQEEEDEAEGDDAGVGLRAAAEVEETQEEYSEEEDDAPAPMASRADVIEILSDEEDEEGPVQQAEYEDDAWEQDEDAEGSEASSDEEYQAAVAKLERGLYAPRDVEEYELENEGGSEEDREDEAVVEEASPVAAEVSVTPYTGFVEEDAVDLDTAEVSDKGEAERGVDIPDSWQGPSTYAEDFYSGGDFIFKGGDATDPHMLPTEEDDEIVEIPGPLRGTPGVDSGVAEETQDVQLPDPWSGPRAYAEDYYAGGDMRESDVRTRLPSPSHLTPVDKELAEFLTPEAGTPEMAPPRMLGTDPVTTNPTEVHDVELSRSLMDELYTDLVDEDPAGRGDSTDAMAAEVDAESDRPFSGSTDSPSPPKFTSHVDWNWPPAFPDGRLALRAGHLQGPEPQDETAEIVEISDDEEESPIIPPAAAVVPSEGHMKTPETVEEDAVIPDGEQDEEIEVQPVDLVPVDANVVEPPGATPGYSNQNMVDDLYADIDAYIASEERQELVGSQAPDAEMASMETDAFIRDFLVGSSVGLDMTEATTSAALVSMPETAAPVVVTAEAPGEVEEPAHGVKTTVAPALENLSPGAAVPKTEYEVEEPATEGRRTEEPDDHGRILSPGIIAEELSEREGSASRSDVDVRVYTVSEPDSYIETADATLDLEDYDDPAIILPDINISKDADVIAHAGDKAQEDTVLDQTTPIELTTSTRHERELEPGVPMPVAADPTVPDPTSVAPSPGETGLSTPFEVDVPQVDASTSRDSSVSAGTSSQGGSPSGLFTPLTAENSRPATPKLRTNDLGDGHFESPLKRVVTAEQLAMADEADSAPTGGADDIQEPVEVDVDASQSTQPPAARPAESDVDSTLPAPSDSTEQPQAHGIPDASELDELNLEYPSDSEEQLTVLAGEEQRAGDRVNPDTSLDPDAEGDVDPDYIPEQPTPVVGLDITEDIGAVTTDEPKANTSKDAVDGDDTAVPDAVETTDVVTPEEPKVDTSADGVLGDNAVEQHAEAMEASVITPEALLETSESATIIQDVPEGSEDPFAIDFAQGSKDEGETQDDSQSSGSSEARPLKRKRELSRLPPRVTRSMLLRKLATDSSEVPPRRKAQRADKDKGRSASRDVDEDSQTPESPSNDQAGEGNELVVATQSTVASQQTSRSSSVVSAALTAGTSTPTSPGLNRTHTYPQTVDAPRLIDAQEVMHHHHGRRVLQAAAQMLGLHRRPTVEAPEPVQEPRAASPLPSRPATPIPSPSLLAPPTRPTSPTASIPSPADVRPPSIPPPASEAGPSTPPDERPNSVAQSVSDTQPSTPLPEVQQPTAAKPPPPQSAAPSRLKAGNSPVTRSRCRFHKISIPSEENGLPVYFVVPGCSLTDRELMKDEDIVDHGVPSFPQGTKLVADLEHLNLNPYLLGILRQLVGVDLLREQEVFYLPQEGEQYAWKPKHQHKHSVPKLKLSARGRKSIGAPIQSGPDTNGHAESISVAPTYSRAGSASTVSSRQSRKGRGSTRSSVANSASLAGSEYSDGSDDERSSKRQKMESVASPIAEVEGDKEESVLEASTGVSRKHRHSKRSKRLGKDAFAYKPDPEDAESSTDEEPGPGTRRRKKGKQRGIKRPRPDDATEEAGAETALPKRRRTRQKVSNQEANGEDK
ncbi:hypothetical protein DAEQUDRAFT_809209 [Daedalea quercina L-15889]|uniref:Uncharacterized protein n=1 Tax=Daedalea quercina L-15889 TaxID=1314783 RepID=A0A165SQ68_9APHY|nr:hypothetical protein DAEQUDRAFT_809209 [Daedalea quercina L-15889]